MTPEQRAQFIANVPDAEARRAAEKVFQAQEDAWAALETACKAAGIEVDDEVIADCGNESIIALNEAYDAAVEAWNAYPGYGGVETDELDHPIRCALSGFLIHFGDSVLKDEETGESVLKDALGVPLCLVTGEFIGPSAAPDSDSSSTSTSTEAVA